MSQEKATPTPWQVWIERDMDAPGYQRIKLVDGEQFIIAELTVSKESQLPDVEKEADRIVKAVNGWNDIQALRARLNELETIVHDGITEDTPEVTR